MELTCRLPKALSVGSVDVEVSVNGVEYFALGARFKYTRDAIVDNVYPAVVGLGSEFVIRGKHFIDSNDLRCRVGSSPNINATWINSTAIRCICPSHTPGNALVTISLE